MDYTQGVRTTADSNAEGRMKASVTSLKEKKKVKKNLLKKALKKHMAAC